MISPELEQILNIAIKKANEKRHEFLTLENVLHALIQDKVIRKILLECRVDMKQLEEELLGFLDNDSYFSILTDEEIEELSREQFLNEEIRTLARQSGIRYQPEISVALQKIIQRAALHVQSSGKKNIQPVNLLVAMYSAKESHAIYFLKKQNVDRMDIIDKIAHGVDRSITGSSNSSESVDPLAESVKEDYKALEDYAVSLNKLAREGKLDPIIGREEEIQRVIQVLCRRRKNNPILVGEAGVGKTAIAEGLALLIEKDEVPEILKEAEIYSLDMASLLAGTKFRGDFEERLKLVLKALDKKNETKTTILFIDEIHTIIGAGSTSGGSLDASNLLKPALSRGTLKCMGSTTYDEFRKTFEKDQALSRRFQKIDVNEPSIEDTINILEGLKSKFEEHHNIKLPYEIIKDVVTLSHKYIHDRKLPDKAIDVIDEVGAYVRVKNSEAGYEITLKDIEGIIAKLARIPEKSISTNEKEKLKNLEQNLKLLIFGQDEAVSKVSNAIILSRSGLRIETKPIANFLFAGPTGVGKTELAKQLALTMGIHFERIDMSEYMEKHSVAKLIGAPPGYVGFDQGGILTEKISRNPYTVLLLDEIEKAHPDIFNILLQVMDHGALTDSNGKVTDFKNTIIIMTSNAGAHEMESSNIGLQGGASSNFNSSKRDQAVKNAFSPEFRNRLDGIIYFNSLSLTNVKAIVDKFLMSLENQLLEKKVELEISPELKEWLAKNGFDPKLGARPLQRLIDEELRKPLAQELVFGKLEKGGKVLAKLKDSKVIFEFESYESVEFSY